MKTTHAARMVRLVALLQSGWQTTSSIQSKLDLPARAVGRMLQEILWAGLPLECHRLGRAASQYRLVADRPVDADAAQRACSPSGAVAQLAWELRRSPMTKDQMQTLLPGCSERAIKRYLATIRAAGAPLRWSDRTSRGVYRGHRVYEINPGQLNEVDWHHLVDLQDGSSYVAWNLEGDYFVLVDVQTRSHGRDRFESIDAAFSALDDPGPAAQEALRSFKSC